MEPFPIAHQLERALLLAFVVEHFDHLPETALAECLQDFIPVRDVVVHQQYVVTFVIILTLVQLLLRGSVDFFTLMPHKVNILLLQDFGHFVAIQVFGVVLHDRFGSERELCFFYVVPWVRGPIAVVWIWIVPVVLNVLVTSEQFFMPFVQFIAFERHHVFFLHWLGVVVRSEFVFTYIFHDFDWIWWPWFINFNLDLFFVITIRV